MARVARYDQGVAPQLADPRARADDNGIGNVADALAGFKKSFSRAVDPVIMASDENRIRGEVASGGEVAPSIGLTPIQVARNTVAQQAYLDRTSLALEGTITELHQEFSGERLDDPENFAKRLDAAAGPLLQGVPEQFRGAAEAHFNTLRTRSVARLQEVSFEAEDRRNVNDIKAANAVDSDQILKAARDGDDAQIETYSAKIAGRYSTLVERGIIGPEVANAEVLKLRDAALGEKLFGQVMRGGGPTLADIRAGRGEAAALTLETRDRLENNVHAELQRARADAARADSEQSAGGKAEREVMTNEVWAKIYSPNAADRPSVTQILDLQRADIITASDAEQMIRTRATSKEARTDLPTLNAREEAIDRGEDVGELISDDVREGRLHPEDAAPLRARNAARRNASLPDPISELRTQSRDLFTVSGYAAKAYQVGEPERKISAVQFFDEQVRAAPDGMDPETSLPNREIAARRAFSVLQERSREYKTGQLLAVPPRNAQFDAPKPGEVGGTKKLRIGRTVTQLRIELENGIITRDEFLAELRLVQQWEDAGLAVK